MLEDAKENGTLFDVPCVQDLMREIKNKLATFNEQEMKMLFYEMSRQLKDIIRKLNDTSDIWYEHLTKLYYIRNDINDFHKWCVSCTNNLRNVSYTSSKFVSFDKLYKEVWLDFEGGMKSYHDRLGNDSEFEY